MPPINAAFLEAQTDEHFDKMARAKIEREHRTPLSQQVLVKFGFLFNESSSGYHLGVQKVALASEQLECPDWLLSAVQEDTPLPSTSKPLAVTGAKYLLLWRLVQCIFEGETSNLTNFLSQQVTVDLHAKPSDGTWTDKLISQIVTG